MGCSIIACLYADGTVLLGECSRELHKADEFYKVCLRRKLEVNVGKGKVMVFEGKDVQVRNLRIPYRVCVSVVGGCAIVLGGKRMEEVKRVYVLEDSVIQEWKNWRSEMIERWEHLLGL